MPNKRRIALLTILMSAWGLAGPGAPPVQAQVNDGELVFGAYPLLSPSQTVERFAPLKEHLAKALGMPVALRSAPDFARFIERTRAGEYDIVFTAPHMGRLAEKRDGYLPIAQTGEVSVVVLTRKDAPVRTLADLQGRSLAVGARLSMTYLIVDHALGKHGLAIGRDVRFVDPASFSNVIEATVRGEADAGATIGQLWDAASSEQRAQLKEIHRAEPAPGFLILAHARLVPGILGKLRQALFDFKDTEAGKAYFKKTQQVDFHPVDAAALKRIDPFAAVLESP